VLPCKLRLRISCELQRSNRLLSEWEHLWWNRKCRASHNRHCLPATTDRSCVRESTSSNDCGSQQPSESSTRRLLRNNNDERPRSPPSCAGKLRNNIASSRSSRLEGFWHWSDRSDDRTSFSSRENVQQDITARGGCFDEQATLISMMLRVTSTCRTRRSRRRIPFKRITLNCLSSHPPLHSSVR
jgi:hypothetical protein